MDFDSLVAGKHKNIPEDIYDGDDDLLSYTR